MAQPKMLAPGFRFSPTDEELVVYYLKRKVCRKTLRFQAVADVDVYRVEPWDLQAKSALKTRDLEWYFFSPRDKKYTNGSRLNRSTSQGYWKATGKDRDIHHKEVLIGAKKTLIFHMGRAPDGQRTNWVMHEYRITDEELEKAGVAQDAFVLCRIFQKSDLGPPTKTRFGPFLEEDWEDDAAFVIPAGEAEDEISNADDVQIGASNFDEATHRNGKAPYLWDIPPGFENHPVDVKRERLEDLEPINFLPNKIAKPDDPNSRQEKGSEGSSTTTTTSHMSSALVGYPVLKSLQAKEKQPAKSAAFDSSSLESSCPPGYLNFISNLENQVQIVSAEKEALKTEVMRAQTTINILRTTVDMLKEEIQDLKRMGGA